MADHECHRCIYRWYWCGSAKWVTKCFADRFDDVSPGRERRRWHTEATARLTVTPAPPPPQPTANVTDEDLFSQNVKDVYFDYDKADIRGDQQASIQADAQFFSQHQNMSFTVEGHCDERGSTEYNLALGDQRASAVKSALTAAGVSASRIKTISYGKEKPFCTESNEACWQQNRRGHLIYQK